MDTSDKSEKILGLINSLHQKMRLIQETKMRKYGLSYGECMQLLTLARESEMINQNILASKLNIDKALVARQLARLESKEFITRTKNPYNQRENEITLTDKAKELVPKLIFSHQQGINQIFTQIPGEDLEIFEKTLATLLCSIEKSINVIVKK